MWDVEGASRKCRLEDHRNYVQVDSSSCAGFGTVQLRAVLH